MTKAKLASLVFLFMLWPATASGQERLAGTSSLYADAVCTGDLVFLSGIVAPYPDPHEQFRWVFERIGELLEEFDSGFERIVDMTTYHIDMREHIDDFIEVKNQFMPELSAWTAVGVTELYSPGAYIEVKIVAAVDRCGP